MTGLKTILLHDKARHKMQSSLSAFFNYFEFLIYFKAINSYINLEERTWNICNTCD